MKTTTITAYQACNQNQVALSHMYADPRKAWEEVAEKLPFINTALGYSGNLTKITIGSQYLVYITKASVQIFFEEDQGE